MNDALRRASGNIQKTKRAVKQMERIRTYEYFTTSKRIAVAIWQYFRANAERVTMLYDGEYYHFVAFTSGDNAISIAKKILRYQHNLNELNME